MNDFKPLLQNFNPYSQELYIIFQEIKRLERRITNIEKNLIQTQFVKQKEMDNLNNNYSLDNYII